MFGEKKLEYGDFDLIDVVVSTFELFMSMSSSFGRSPQTSSSPACSLSKMLTNCLKLLCHFSFFLVVPNTIFIKAHILFASMMFWVGINELRHCSMNCLIAKKRVNDLEARDIKWESQVNTMQVFCSSASSLPMHRSNVSCSYLVMVDPQKTDQAEWIIIHETSTTAATDGDSSAGDGSSSISPHRTKVVAVKTRRLPSCKPS